MLVNERSVFLVKRGYVEILQVNQNAAGATQFLLSTASE